MGAVLHQTNRNQKVVDYSALQLTSCKKKKKKHQQETSNTATELIYRNELNNSCLMRPKQEGRESLFAEVSLSIFTRPLYSLTKEFLN